MKNDDETKKNEANLLDEVVMGIDKKIRIDFDDEKSNVAYLTTCFGDFKMTIEKID